MKKFTSNFKLFLLLAAMVAGVSDAWGYDAIGTTAVISGNGTAQVEVFAYPFGIESSLKKSSTTTNQTEVTAKGSVSAGGTDTRAKFYAVANSGYSFAGWYSAQSITSTKLSESLTYSTSKTSGKSTRSYTAYALFTPNNYTVTFNANGGTCSPASKTVTFDATYGELATATRSGYLFAGWFTAATGGTQVTASSTVQIANNHTLYAHWQPLFYFSATANKNTATENTVTAVVANASITGTVGQTSAQTTATFTATPNATKGYNFVGWYIDEACTNRESVESTYFTTITNTIAGSTQNKTLYAKFVQQLTPEFSGADQTLKVEDTYTGFAFRNTSTAKPTTDGDFYYTFLENTPSCITSGSTHPSEIIGYDPETNTLTAYNAGTAKIKFAQKAVGIYDAAEITYTITVSKYENHISVNGSVDSYIGNIYTDAQLAIALTATNTDYVGSPITATQTAGEAVATLAAGKVSSNHNLGTATWSVSQPENYKYLAANASFSINVIKQAEATDCYVKTLETTVIEKKLGNYSDNYTWEDENAAGVLYFSAKRQGASIGDKIKVEQLVEGSWTVVGGEITGYGTSYTPEQITLNPNAKGIRFWVAGSLNNSITNVRVTRKTYLNVADVTINKTNLSNPVCPGDQGVGTLVINRSLANGGDLKVVWDNDKFTINGKTNAEGVNLGNFDCATGVSELQIIFNAAAAGTETAHVVIYNNVYRATATITGETVKRTQDFEWHIDNVIPAGFSIAKSEAFTSTRSAYEGVSYSFSPAGIIEIEGENLVAKTAGTVDVTAHVNGGVEYNDVEETKTITVTNDLIQSIAWSQSLMGLHLGDADLTLTASATSEETCSTNGLRTIVYTSADESVVTIVNGNQLHIVGEGKTIVTASQAGGLDADGHTYVAVSAEKKVVVRDPSAVCENYIYEQDAEVKFDLGWNAVGHQTKSQEISFNGNEPGYYNFDYKGEPINVLFEYYDGEMIVEQYVNGVWSQVQNLGKPAKSTYKNTGDVALDRRATKMRVIANDGMGYHYFKDCQVSLARYIELLAESNVVSEMNFSTKCGASLDSVVTIHYSNLTDNLTFSLPDGCPFSLDKTSVDASCGDKGNVGLKITYTPMAPETDAVYDLTISDGTTTTVVALHASATITDRVLSWEQVPADVYTVETVDFTAVAQTTLGDAAGSVAYSVVTSTPADMATIAGNKMNFTKAGQVTVEAAAVPDARYTMPASQTKTWTVVKTPTAVITSPAITTSPLVAGADVAALTFDPGVAQNTVNAEEVSGTFTITSTGLLVSGTNTLWFEFTPDDTDMYLPTTASVDIEVFDAFVFEGNGGTSEEWGTNTNWNTGSAPSATDNVVINSDVKIVGDITVNSLTINEGVKVSVEVDGKLTIGAGNSVVQDNYGNLYVHKDGEVVLTTGELKVNDFYLESSLGNRFNSVDAKSGELINGGKLNLNGNAYFDLVLDPSGEISYGLYDFVLPFDVDATNGIYYVDALGAHKMTFNMDYAIGAFSESRRAQGAKAWRTFGGTMEKGKGYTISMDDAHPERNVIRFVKQDETSINLDNTVAMLSSGTDVDCGWNAVGNSALYHATIGLPDVSEVQLYNHAANAYTAFAKDAFTYVVGSAFYVQVPNATTMTLNQATSGTLQAPQRENLHSIEKMELNIKALDATVVEDRFFFLANEDATTSYEIGHDLQKMGTPTDAKIAQVWANAYGRKMCAVELPLENSELTIPFEMFVPAAGDYVLSIPVLTDATVYLLRNGELLWNLSESEYVITLPKGVTTGYSLGVQYNAPAHPTVPTSFETMSDAEASVVKVIVNGTLYLINKADHTVYDAMGHIVH